MAGTARPGRRCYLQAMRPLPSPRGPRAAAAAVVVAWAALAGPAAADDAAASYACAPARPTTKLTATFEPEVSVAELAAWVASFTCESVIIAPDVARHATRVQIVAPAPMSPRQAVKLFVNSLEAAGLRVRRKDRTFLVTLGPGMPRGCPDVAAAAGDEDPFARPLPLDADALADKAAASVRRIDDAHVELPRAVLDEILANPALFARGARVLPAVKAGKATGFKLYAVRPGSLFARLGLANGDTVTAFGGQPLDSLERALGAFGALRSARQVEVGVLRRGTPFTLVITIVN